jgi:predicted secreted protein
MTGSDYFEQFICKYIPLNQVIGENEEVLWTSEPAKDIVARIFFNNTRIQRILFLSFFVIVEIILIGISLPSIVQNFQATSLILFLIFLSLFSIAAIYLLYTLLKLKVSAFISQNWYSEFALTNKKLYLKLTRLIYPQKGQPITCKICIVDLLLIRAIKFYKSFWDRHYKETGSFRIKLTPPHHSINIHNLPQPETFMSTISKVLDSLHTKSS